MVTLLLPLKATQSCLKYPKHEKWYTVYLAKIIKTQIQVSRKKKFLFSLLTNIAIPEIMSGNSNNNSNNEQHYPYDQYHNYYYQQYYANAPPQPQIPQGDPSAALSTMVYQLQQQTQQRQAMGALAAASISSVLGNNKQQPPVEYYADYYAVNDQRSVINYDDLSLPNNTLATEVKAEAADKPEISPKK
jgi:hypothetical protein